MERFRSHAQNVSLFAFGVVAALAQILLLRALLSEFGGNELLVGMGVFFWLALGGLFSALFGFFSEHPASRLVGPLFSLTPPAVLVGLFIIRHLSDFFRVPPGAASPPEVWLIAAFLGLLPASVCLGGLFSLFVQFLKSSFGEALRRAALYEALGSAFGGLAFGSLLVHVLGEPGVLAVLSASAFAAMWTAFSGGDASSGKPAVFFWAIPAFCPLLLFPLATPTDPPGSIRLRLENRLGTFTATDQAVYHGRSPVSFPDETRLEESERLAVLLAGLHPSSDPVLVLGGSVRYAKMLAARLHRSVTHVQPNPDLERLEDAMEPGSAAPQGFVSIVADPVRFLASHPVPAFGLVLVSAPLPDSIVSGRWLSGRLFEKTKAVLLPRGLLLARFGEASNAISRPEADLLLSALEAAHPHFALCQTFSLERYGLVCTDGEIDLNPENLFARASSVGIRSEFAGESWLRDGLSESRREMLRDALAGARARGAGVNARLAPRAPFHGLLLALGRFHPRWLNASGTLFGVVRILTILLLVGFVSLSLWAARSGGVRLTSGLAVAATGAGGVLVELSVLSAFQIGHGELYAWLGVLVGAYLAGFGLGAHVAHRRTMLHGSLRKRVMRALSIAAGLQILSLPCLPILSGDVGSLGTFLSGVLAFVLLAALAAASGAVFQTAAMNAETTDNHRHARLAGWIRGLDHTSGSLAALFGGVFLIPLQGLWLTASLAAGISLPVLLAFFVRSRREG